MNSEKGFSLLEVLIGLVIVGLMLGMVAVSPDYMKRHRLKSASRELLADLHGVRQKALTKGSVSNSRGFGVRFDSATGYSLFEFNDTDDDYTYDDTGEELAAAGRDLPSNITVMRWDGSSLVGPETVNGGILLYDKRGMARTSTWGPVGDVIYVLASSGFDRSRCVNVGRVMLREGVWNGSACAYQ